MSIEVGTLVTSYKSDTRDLERGAERAERRVQESARRMNATLSGVGSSFGSGGFLERLSNISNVISALPAVGTIAHALVNPLMQAASAGIEFNATLESARIGFQGIIGDSAKTEEHLKRLQSFASRTPFEFTGLLSASRYMNVFGIAIDDQIPKLRVWGDVIASSGKFSEDAVMGVVRAFGQMSAKGRLSAEEMEQLAERGFPAWELLAKAIGKTVGETRKLSEQGKLKGREAMEAITAMAETDPRFKGQMEKQSQSFYGRVSNLRDLEAQAAGLGTENLFNSINKSLEDGLKQSGLVMAMAGSINTAIAPVGKLVEAAASGLLGGGITSGLTEGISAGQAIVGTAVKELGLGAIFTFAKTLGIFSPSKVFYGFGLSMGEGLMLGLQEMLTKMEARAGDTLRKIAERLGRGVEEFTAINPGIMPDDPLRVGQEIWTPFTTGGKKGGKKSRRGGVGVLSAEINAIIEENARRTGIDPDLIRAMISVESSGDLGAISPKGARGIMQLMPATAARFGVSNIFDPAQNIKGGTDYMRFLLDKFKGNVPLALAGYNAGEGAVSKYGGIPPYKETQEYVRKIEARYAAMQKQGGGFLGAWTKSNPLPVYVPDIYGGAGVLGGQVPTAEELDRAGGWGDSSGIPGLPSFSLSGMSGGSSNPFGRSNLEMMLFQGKLDLHNIADTLGTIPQMVNQVGQAYEQTKPGIGQWYDLVVGGSKSLHEQLEEISNDLPTLNEQLKGFTTDAPKTIGGIFGNAVRGWDGTLKGFGRSIALGFADAMKETSAQIIENLITKGTSKLLSSIFTPSTDDVVKALDESFMFTPLQQGFGLNTTAVSVNSTSTDLNTAALNQNTAALQQQAMAGQGGGGGGLLGTLLSGALGGLAGGFSSIGGFFGNIFGGGSFSTSVSGYTLDPPAGYASGGNPPIGQWSLVGEKGAELVKFGAPATVYPNSESKRMMGGHVTNVTNIINVPVARSSGYTQPKNRRQVADDIFRRLK